ncbi:tRNA pseudouridine(55) synthase TruB [Prochlorococcus sp. MIT 1307]|uniref:tRNA pseudouridine(55) synthase TruB n=1 Tax=Prochlorococcus sp. MIT 1307 TaxID=3096219 RepID=UPI002A754F26|nr:tRNA pseudouridine(55) synthase TruB [Prochlorococcus sp. MIT 1307]
MNNPFGFVIIDKEQGLTSHDCVNKVRKIFGIKRVGHGGTLDPSVTGVLPIALGPATRLLTYLPSDKRYRGIIQLGKRTTTDDLDGEIISNQPWPKIEQTILNKHLDMFRGKIRQQPPNISSIHIKGERAYKKALRGEVFDLPDRSITIHEILLLGWDQSTGRIEINVHCSSGTYIRALARDLGNSLGCGGCLAKLRRTEALGFNEKQALPLPTTSNEHSAIPLNVVSPLQALRNLPRLKLTTETESIHWRTGRQLNITRDRIEPSSEMQFAKHQPEEVFILVSNTSAEVLGIGGWDGSSTLKSKVVFQALG